MYPIFFPWKNMRPFLRRADAIFLQTDCNYFFNSVPNRISTSRLVPIWWRLFPLSHSLCLQRRMNTSKELLELCEEVLDELLYSLIFEESSLYEEFSSEELTLVVSKSGGAVHGDKWVATGVFDFFNIWGGCTSPKGIASFVRTSVMMIHLYSCKTLSTMTLGEKSIHLPHLLWCPLHKATSTPTLMLTGSWCLVFWLYSATSSELHWLGELVVVGRVQNAKETILPGRHVSLPILCYQAAAWRCPLSRLFQRCFEWLHGDSFHGSGLQLDYIYFHRCWRTSASLAHERK